MAIRKKWAAPIVVQEYTVEVIAPPEGLVGPAATEQQTEHVVVQEHTADVVGPTVVSVEPGTT